MNIQFSDTTSKPLVIVDEPSETGPRVGGNPPRGVIPRLFDSTHRCFGTFPLDDGRELSLFFSEDGNRWISPSSSIRSNMHDSEVRICVHEPSSRGSHSVFTSGLRPLRVVVGDPGDDSVFDPLAKKYGTPVYQPRLGNKLGGVPYAIHWNWVKEAYAELRARGAVHILQLELMDHTLNGIGPENGMVHIFGIAPFQEDTLYWVYEF